MVTLKQIFQVFGHDAKWARFATASAVPMTTVFLRKLGDRDIKTLTDFDIQLQLAMSEQPEDRKVKARACIDHLRAWAAEQGKPFAQPEHEPKPKAEPKPKVKKPKAEPKPKVKKHKADPKPKAQPKPKVEKPSKEKRIVKRCEKAGDQQAIRQDLQPLDPEAWQDDQRKRRGTIYHDTASKGWKNGKRVFSDRWRADIMIHGVRYRYRAETRQECAEWLKAVTSKKIMPTDNKADWWRMEQHKDEEARIDELIVSAAEEAHIVYEYRQSGDTQILYDYCTKALLPHMVYYCAHTLRLGRDRTLTASRQAVGLILTKIVGGRPVTNITFTCKRMLRTYASRGDFWYYDKAPETVKLMVNRIDMSALEELYKVTKDRRI